MDKMSNTISFFTLLLIQLLVCLLDGHDKTLRLAFAESSNVSVSLSLSLSLVVTIVYTGF